MDKAIAQEYVQRATEAAVIMADLAGDHYTPERRQHWQRELAGQLEQMARMSKELLEMFNGLFDPKMDRMPWAGTKPKQSTTLKVKDVRLTVDPMVENRESATERLKEETKQAVKDLLRESYGDYKGDKE